MATTEDVVPCAGQIADFDAFVDATANTVALPLPDDFLATIYLLGGDEYTSLSPCPPGSYGCATLDGPNEIFVQGLDAVDHELVHSIVGRQLDQAPDWFDEGLAEALGPKAPMAVFHAGRSPLDVDGAPKGDEYFDAGAFTHWLITTYGMEQFMSFYRASGGPVNDWHPVFAEEFGDSIEDAVAAFDSVEDHCFFLLRECAEAPMPWTDESHWLLDRSVSCGLPDVAGSYTEDSILADTGYRTFGIQIPDSGAYIVQVSEPTRMASCTTCRAYDIPQGSATPLLLDAGRWVLLGPGLGTSPRFVAEVRRNDAARD